MRNLYNILQRYRGYKNLIPTSSSHSVCRFQVVQSFLNMENIATRILLEVVLNSSNHCKYVFTILEKNETLSFEFAQILVANHVKRKSLTLTVDEFEILCKHLRSIIAGLHKIAHNITVQIHKNGDVFLREIDKLFVFAIYSSNKEAILSDVVMSILAKNRMVGYSYYSACDVELPMEIDII